jgi:hypothetical protein
MEPWQGVDAHNGAVEAQNGALECLSVDQWSQILIIFMRSRLRFRNKVKSWIRIRIIVTRIRNTASEYV